ncbi:class I SAM-dependent methyltransferase [Rhizobiaceae bacterium BDR2-2]|uniref:Class I SAM-dependent methyltransferase n=1 Tax=Ectorhizobium quercum TaxID=2965071 RepID=A0AAE3N0A7_9HYPH|nr:class I SAM-dependent methyltransferase [Ectorhizobium quercum]MCX8996482.1 class I SAM-dependent methyltransferase [Ectorhizobium quercum]
MKREETAATADHARLMDRIYRGQKHIYDATRKYYLFGRDRTIAGLDARPGQSLLELGCGTGRNLLLATRRFPGLNLHGLDISREMLETAKARFGREGVQATFVAGDATRCRPADFGVEGFDRIMISYALSMIPDWKGTLDAAFDALTPGGSIHIVDFGDQSGLPRWFRTLLRAWLAQFHVAPRDDMPAVLAGMCRARNLSLAVETIGRGYAVRAVASA